MTETGLRTEDFSKYNGERTTLRSAQMRLLDMLLEFDRICRKNNIEYFISGGTCLGAIRHGGFIPWDDDIDVDVWHTDYTKLENILPKELSDNYFMQTPKTDDGFYRLYMKVVDKKSRVDYGESENNRQFIRHKGLSIDILPLRHVYSYRLKRVIDRVYYPAFKIKRTKNRQNLYKTYAALALEPIMRLTAATARMLTFLSPMENVSHEYGTGMTPKLRHSTLFPPRPIEFEGYKVMGPAKPNEYLRGLYGNYMTIPPEDKREIHSERIEVFDCTEDRLR